MTGQIARTHTHLSNRAKVRSAQEHKPVFRSVLENPFQLSWPSIPINIQNVFLARLVAALESVPSRTHASRKSPQKTAISGQQKIVDITEEVQNSHIRTSPSRALDQVGADRVPSGPAHLVIGINSVTRALELQLRGVRKRVVVDNTSQNDDQLPLPVAPSPILVVFACYADVDPSALVDHILYLVAGCNSPRNVTQPIKLVPLPKGSEPTISQILGVRRAAVVAFRERSPLLETIQDILGSVSIVSAPWLCPSDTHISQLVPTHIKQLRTTAPKDMKAAREQRSKARAAAKKNVSSSSRAVRRKPRVKLTTG